MRGKSGKASLVITFAKQRPNNNRTARAGDKFRHDISLRTPRCIPGSSRCLLDVLDSELNCFLYFYFRCSTASQTTASLQGRLTQYGKSKRRAVPPALSSSVTRASHPISHAKFSDECIQIRSTGQHCSQLMDMAAAAGS